MTDPCKHEWEDAKIKLSFAVRCKHCGIVQDPTNTPEALAEKVRYSLVMMTEMPEGLWAFNEIMVRLAEAEKALHFQTVMHQADLDQRAVVEADRDRLIRWHDEVCACGHAEEHDALPRPTSIRSHVTEVEGKKYALPGEPSLDLLESYDDE